MSVGEIVTAVGIGQSTVLHHLEPPLFIHQTTMTAIPLRFCLITLRTQRLPMGGRGAWSLRSPWGAPPHYAPGEQNTAD
ncbi:hypothetical protein ACFQVD_30320 [Streptosporangium amethystogenes subsp. fukuiense]|uniref:Uncharacterized protein n=1 Tax=Streptosporangium amethystogenes subsp. fukuiense TaxID=698418 RepID=A0ABW2T8U5_9ACTN